jgi:hypothetical protein
MTISLNGRLDEQAHLVQATGAAALTSTAGDGAYVSLKNYRRATVLVDITNGSTVTGTAVTLKQATAVAGTGEKALGFTRMLANIDLGAGQAPSNYTETAVSNNTFTSSAVNSKKLRYIIEVDSDQLDSVNGFDCFRVDADGAVNSTGIVTYILWGARNSGANSMID